MLSPLEEKALTTARELQNIQSQINSDRLAYIRATYGIAFGSVVTGYDKNQYLVSAIQPNEGKPFIKGKPVTKQGTFSKVNRYLGDRWNALLF